jgi:hypothetical protein
MTRDRERDRERERERERERGHLKEFLFETTVTENKRPKFFTQTFKTTTGPQWFHLIYDSDYVRLSTM